jgi:hypothetical protein
VVGRLARILWLVGVLSVAVAPLRAQPGQSTQVFLPVIAQQVTLNALPLGYHTADQIAASLAQLASQSPAIATLQQIGLSWETTRGLVNRPIWALRLCHTCANRPAVVYLGGQHAREIATPELMLQLAQDIVAGWPSDPTIGPLLDQVVIWIVPLANPDGHAQVEAGLANWRKNVDSSNDPPGDAALTLPDGIGVDLNRNFAYEWGQGGASATPGAFNYQGPAPASEPETQALQGFLASVRPVILLDYHSPDATVLWPWGYQSGPTPAAATLRTMGAQLAALTGYGFGQTSATYGITTGDTLDWAYGTLGTYALGVEIDGGFAPDSATVDAIYTKNRPALLLAASWAPCPTCVAVH